MQFFYCYPTGHDQILNLFINRQLNKHKTRKHLGSYLYFGIFIIILSHFDRNLTGIVKSRILNAIFLWFFILFDLIPWLYLCASKDAKY
jgi:hypothetical protein